MKIWITSDVHLSQKTPELNARFFKFLDNLPELDGLYLIGDIFEYWVGADIKDPIAERLAEYTQKLSQRFPVYFMPGNHDFLLEPTYAHTTGMTYLQDHTVVNMPQKMLLLHGDSLCLEDKLYQKYRKFVRHPRVEKFFLGLPRFVRLKIANYLRHKSNQYAPTADISIETALLEGLAQEHQIKHIIHGHIHKPQAITHSNVAYWTLGEWTKEEGWFIEVTETDVKLQRY